MSARRHHGRGSAIGGGSSLAAAKSAGHVEARAGDGAGEWGTRKVTAQATSAGVPSLSGATPRRAASCRPRRRGQRRGVTTVPLGRPTGVDDSDGNVEDRGGIIASSWTLAVRDDRSDSLRTMSGPTAVRRPERPARPHIPRDALTRPRRSGLTMRLRSEGEAHARAWLPEGFRWRIRLRSRSTDPRYPASWASEPRSLGRWIQPSVAARADR